MEEQLKVRSSKQRDLDLIDMKEQHFSIACQIPFLNNQFPRDLSEIVEGRSGIS